MCYLTLKLSLKLHNLFLLVLHLKHLKVFIHWPCHLLNHNLAHLHSFQHLLLSLVEELQRAFHLVLLILLLIYSLDITQLPILIFLLYIQLFVCLRVLQIHFQLLSFHQFLVIVTFFKLFAVHHKFLFLLVNVISDHLLGFINHLGSLLDVLLYSFFNMQVILN